MSKRQLFELLKSRNVNWFNSAINISLRNKYVYVEVPKVASSTIKSHLNKIELATLINISVGPHPEILSSPHVKPYQLSAEDLSDILFGDDFFKFTFVRNPYERILSAYLDKIVGNTPEKKQIDNNRDMVARVKSDEYSFGEFIDIVAKIPDNIRDKHWRTQCSITMKNHIKYNYIGKIERFNADIHKIQHISGINFDGIKEFSPHKTGAKSKIDKYYSDENLKKSVIDIYDKDFEAFGYMK